MISSIVVYQVKDTIFWKQITTAINCTLLCQSLFIKSKIQFFESKSQRRIFNEFYRIGCLSSQRYNFLKANHNTKRVTYYKPKVVYQVKDTIFWKQITTKLPNFQLPLSLFIKSKIQFFESKSQLNIWAFDCGICCLSSQRYNFLKANHNNDNDVLFIAAVVYQVKDTIFWKQITTWLIHFQETKLLFIKSKIQFFESKSQQLVNSF